MRLKPRSDMGVSTTRRDMLEMRYMALREPIMVTIARSGGKMTQVAIASTVMCACLPLERRLHVAPLILCDPTLCQHEQVLSLRTPIYDS